MIIFLIHYIKSMLAIILNQQSNKIRKQSSVKGKKSKEAAADAKKICFKSLFVNYSDVT